METVNLKDKVICALRDELRLIGAENLLEASDLDDDGITLFRKSFKIVILNSIRENDAMNVIKHFFPEDSRPDRLLLTSPLTAQTALTLASNNVNYCDSNANMRISINGIMLSNENAFARPASDVSLNLNTFSSLKVVFCLLQYIDSIHWPMRKLSEVSGVSLGAVQRVMAGLKRLSIIFHTPKGRFFRNKRKLLGIWVDGFNSVILPKITLGKAIFRNPATKTNWQELALKNDAFWGGEPAAHIYDGYLLPESFSIFTSDDFRSTVRNMDLVPVGNTTGYISVLHKFWNTYELQPSQNGAHVAPVLVVYAQLMGSYDSRCVDAAKRLLTTIGDEELY